MRTGLIVVNGKPRSGKDEFASFCSKYLDERGQVGTVYSTITTCVEMATIAGYKTYYSDKEAITPEQRLMLSELKDWYTKHFDGTFNEMVFLLDVSTRRDDGFCSGERFSFIFAMVREPSEIQKIKDHCYDNNIFFSSVIGYSDRAQKEASCHSDKNVEEFDYDNKFVNDGTLDDLNNKAINLVDFLIEQYMNFEEDNQIDAGELEPK